MSNDLVLDRDPAFRVVRMFTVWEFADGSYDAVVSQLGPAHETERLTSGSPDDVRSSLHAFLANTKD